MIILNFSSVNFKFKSKIFFEKINLYFGKFDRLIFYNLFINLYFLDRNKKVND